MHEHKITDWEIPDPQREVPTKYWQPSRRLIIVIRKYQRIKNSKNPVNILLRKIYVVKHRFWSIVTGAEIDLTCKLGIGLLLPHPNGIVIHPQATIGVNCLMFQQVTIAGKVEIGYHVDIGAGVKIIGPLQIGNNVMIGANSVVTRNVPSNVVIAGAPAKVLRSYSDFAEEKENIFNG